MSPSSSVRRIGEFTVVKRLGGGGMGTVYLCRTPGGQRLAVKVIREDFTEDREIRLRFAREVAALREVHSPYTVPVYAAETSRPPLWLATRYLDGPTLTTQVREEGPLPTGLVASCGLMLAEALATVHARGVIHRDVKPDNIVLEGGEPRLIDFGIARSVAEAAGLTRPGAVLGSPGYMAPEQLAGRPPSPAVDVFALGAVLTYAATGRPPFGTGQEANLLIGRGARPDLSSVPKPLAAIVAAMLAHGPAARPAPEEVMAALTDLIATAQESTRVVPAPGPPHRCRVPGPAGGCALRSAAAGLLDAGLTHSLVRKALVHHDR
ncbi:serine/threonine-protein kinase [Streptomyces sp. NPDC007070]|uniref:serine/threonine-protein kinase n=1 Tax=Streptomyces sp. NPDC007070 TaxID=3154312 RepID=UPI0033FA0C9B